MRELINQMAEAEDAQRDWRDAEREKIKALVLSARRRVYLNGQQSDEDRAALEAARTWLLKQKRTSVTQEDSNET